MAEESIGVWQRQPWDTEVGFYVFQTFYLPQTGQRSVDEAYRQYIVQKYGRSPTRASKTCRRWANALDHLDKPIPNALTWAARAQAWDDHLAQQAQEHWAERTQALREREWKLAQALMDKAEQMLKFPLAEVERTTKVEHTPDGQTIINHITQMNPSRWFFGDAARVIKEASRVARLATGQETENTKHSGEVAQVGMTLEEWQAQWKKQTAQRRQQVAETLAQFEENEVDK